MGNKVISITNDLTFGPKCGNIYTVLQERLFFDFEKYGSYYVLKEFPKAIWLSSHFIKYTITSINKNIRIL